METPLIRELVSIARADDEVSMVFGSASTIKVFRDLGSDVTVESATSWILCASVGSKCHPLDSARSDFAAGRATRKLSRARSPLPGDEAACCMSCNKKRDHSPGSGFRLLFPAGQKSAWGQSPPYQVSSSPSLSFTAWLSLCLEPR
jgi:hypothetical protein